MAFRNSEGRLQVLAGALCFGFSLLDSSISLWPTLLTIWTQLPNLGADKLRADAHAHAGHRRRTSSPRTSTCAWKRRRPRSTSTSTGASGPWRAVPGVQQRPARQGRGHRPAHIPRRHRGLPARALRRARPQQPGEPRRRRRGALAFDRRLRPHRQVRAPQARPRTTRLRPGLGPTACASSTSRVLRTALGPCAPTRSARKYLPCRPSKPSCRWKRSTTASTRPRGWRRCQSRAPSSLESALPEEHSHQANSACKYLQAEFCCAFQLLESSMSL
jgi:hypothetical protein